MESIEPSVKWPFFASISVKIGQNWWEWVSKLVIFSIGEFFELAEVESIEPSVKMTIFFKHFGQYWWKSVEMGSKIGQFRP